MGNEQQAGMLSMRHFGLATWEPRPASEFQDKVALLGKAMLWLLDRRLPDGTWGGLDLQERFDTTLQVAQTLLLVGIAPDSEILQPALTFLADQDLSLPITFWRAGTFINIPGFQDAVLRDLNFGWSEPRAGLLGYPPPLFLLKCLRFLDDPSHLLFTRADALQRVLAEWTPEKCWSDRASLTAMGMALVHDLEFENRESVLSGCRKYLLGCVDAETAAGRVGFAQSLAEDCFVIFDICEMPSVFAAEQELAAIIKRRVDTIWAEQTEAGFWYSVPPFKGSTAGGGLVEPTALAIRALASYYATIDAEFVSAISANVLERCAMEAWSRRRLYPLAEEIASGTAARAHRLG